MQATKEYLETERTIEFDDRTYFKMTNDDRIFNIDWVSFHKKEKELLIDVQGYWYGFNIELCKMFTHEELRYFYSVGTLHEDVLHRYILKNNIKTSIH